MRNLTRLWHLQHVDVAEKGTWLLFGIKAEKMTKIASIVTIGQKLETLEK